MPKRPMVSSDLKQKVLTEAGHRCAIPTCRHRTTEIAHIIPWAKVKEHSFENLIALCPNCHTDYDVTKKISQKAMMQYKANLALLNGRYSDLERRVLQTFIDEPDREHLVLFGGLEFMLSYLIKDKIIYDTGKGEGVGMGGSYGFVYSEVVYALTPEGRLFINNWIEAKELS